MDINIDLIAQRGGLVDSDDDFVVVACTKCGAQFLYNEETLVVYSEPQDLSRRFLNVMPPVTPACPRCPDCDDADWDFIYCQSEAEVRRGRWGWILK
jgi:hypothetical protein